MPIDLDGVAVLRALVQHPDLFPTARSSANDLAHKIVSGRLTKKPTLDVLRRVKALLTDSDFRLITDEISDKACRSLLKAVDPHHPLLKEAGADFRARIFSLSAGSAEPAPKPEKPAKASGTKRSGKPPAERKTVRKRKTPVRTLSSRAMNAAWDGKNRDDDPDT